MQNKRQETAVKLAGEVWTLAKLHPWKALGAVWALWMGFTLLGAGYGFVTTLGLWLLLGWGPPVALYGWLNGWWGGSPTGAYGAKFAAIGETRKFFLKPDEVGRAHAIMTAVHDSGAVMAVKPYTVASIQKELGHVPVIAPTRSGKGLHLTANLLSWPSSCAVLDIKGENWRTTSAYRATLGPVYVLNPEGYGARFDFLAELLELGSEADAALLQAATLMVRPEDEKQQIFPRKAISALMAGMRAAHRLGEPVLPWVYAASRRGLRAYVETVQAVAEDLGDERITDYLTEYLDREPHAVTAALWDSDKALFVQAWSNLTKALSEVCTEGVLKMASGRDFRPADLKRQPSTLYLIWREDMGAGVRRVFELVALALTKGLSRYADAHAGEPQQEVLFVIDEAGTFEVPELPTLMATLAGRGVWLMPYFQGLQQIEDVFGVGASQAVIGNASAVLWYPSNETPVMRYVEAAAGKTSVVTTSTTSSTTKSAGGSAETFTDLFGSTSTSEGTTASTTDRPLITGDEFARLGDGRVLVQTRNHPWMRARALRWFELPELKARGGAVGVNGDPIAFDVAAYRRKVQPPRSPGVSADAFEPEDFTLPEP